MPSKRGKETTSATPAYFELNGRNHNESGVVQWFPKWMEKMREKFPDEYQSQGEVRFFASYAWGDHNFMCSILKSGCDTVPSCETVVKRVLAYRNDSKYSLEDNLSEARRIYFMAEEIHAMAEFMFYQWVCTKTISLNDITDEAQNLLDRVKINAGLAIDAIVSQFTEQPDPEADQICSLLILAYTTVLEIGKSAMNAFCNAPETIANVVMLAEAAGEMLLSAVLENETAVTDGDDRIYLAPVGSGNDEKDETDIQKWDAQKVTQGQKAIVAMIGATMRAAGRVRRSITQSTSAAKDGQHDEPWQGMVATPATQFCSGLGGGLKDEIFKRASQLKDYILKAFHSFRGDPRDSGRSSELDRHRRSFNFLHLVGQSRLVNQWPTSRHKGR